MDPVIIDLTTKAIAVLIPFISKGAEEFASKVGDATYEKAKTLLTLLKQKWSGDQEAESSLTLFEKKPERYKTVLEEILQEKLSQDADLVSRVKFLLQEMGPTLDILQKMEEGTNITGLKAKDMRVGRATVTQEITKADGVTGAEFDSLG